MSDWIEKLERITRLHQAGGLTDEEFATQKSRILDQGRDTSKDRAPVKGVVYSPIESPPRFPRIGIALVGLFALAGTLGFAAYSALGTNSDFLKKDAERSEEVLADNVIMPPEESVASTPAATFTPLSPIEPIVVPSDAAITYNPSFKCTSKLARTETLICQNRELSEKDRRLSTMFKVILAEADISDRSDLLSRQRRLLAERSTCDEVYCLSIWYDRVIEFYEPYYTDGPPKM